MEPTSPFLIAIIAAFAAAGLFGVVVLRHAWLRAVVAAALAGCGLLAGLVAVNDYYGYYQSWTALAADFGSGSTMAGVTTDHGSVKVGEGRLMSLDIAGQDSGINRPALVWLPPQYFAAGWSHVRFPVIELFHGSPGDPENWSVQLRITAVMQTLMKKHLIGPVVLVMPSSNAGTDAEECLNSATAKDATYVTTDVRNVVEQRFRVGRAWSEWAAGGFSSGGYCAANLTFDRHHVFGAGFSLDGYFDPNAGPAAAVLDHVPAALAANNPLRTAERAHWGGDVPPFWLAAGTSGDDSAQAHALVKALHGVERVPLAVESGAGHNFYTWAAALPEALSWTWQQISPLWLRSQFPVAGSARAVHLRPFGVNRFGLHRQRPTHRGRVPASTGRPSGRADQGTARVDRPSGRADRPSAAADQPGCSKSGCAGAGRSLATRSGTVPAV